MADEGPAVPGETWRSALKGVASLVAPTTVVTSLLYYFGWARTSVQARAMGLEQSLFGYSTSDYILRSLSSLFAPMFVGLAVVAIGLAVHAAILSKGWGLEAAASGRAGSVRWLVGLLALLATGGAVLLAVGLISAADDEPTRRQIITSPLFVTVGIGLIGYALHLKRKAFAPDSGGRWSAEARSFHLLSATVFPVLLLLGLFWTVSKYAALKGQDLAALIDQQQQQLPDATIFSAKPLQLQPPVVERQIGSPDSGFAFQYTGLKLLFRSDGRYFLRPVGSDLNILIPESPDLRFEFSRPRGGG